MSFPTRLTALAIAAALSMPALPAMAQPRDCPPGLAKKDPPCVPPGQARKGFTTEEWLSRHRIGERANPDRIDWLTDRARYDLPPLAEGQRYAVIDGMLVALDAESYEILQLIRAATAVLD